MFQMVHPAEQPGIDVADGQHAVHIRPVDADGNPDVGDLGRAGGEEKYADLPWRIAGLLDLSLIHISPPCRRIKEQEKQDDR